MLEPFYRYVIEKKIKLNKSRRENINFETAKEIGILYSASGQNSAEVFHNFVYELKLKNKSFIIINYSPKPTGISLKYDCIKLTDKDINWMGSYSMQEITAFIRKPFDILYCISETLPLAFELILCDSKAKFRVGRFYPGKEGLFDFMIDTKQSDSIPFLIEQIIHFSGVIKK